MGTEFIYDAVVIGGSGTPAALPARALAERGIDPPPPLACPTTLWDVFGEQGHPVRATVSDMGPLMLARMLALMGIVWVADSAAYFAGHQWGKRKLAPSVSPGKTWEGVAGAALAVAVYHALVWNFGFGLHAPGLALAAAALVAILFPLSVIGDLFESWIKRQAGVKDSGTLLPGHGGVLDRIDALTSTLPLAALTVTFLLQQG